jgi:hypothetical protein
MSGWQVMAELPDLRTERLPERPAEQRQLFDRPHAYGVAQELERIKQGFAPPPRTPRIRTRGRRERAGLRASLRRRWAESNARPVDLWHRLRCRRGRHEFRGGEQIQLGSRFVYVERRCVWCDAAPPAPY